VLAATHRAERVAGWATGTLVLDRGRVVEDTMATSGSLGTPAGALAGGRP
jgi:energy-coupling factor transporter ATP-binding protein EcfA2